MNPLSLIYNLVMGYLERAKENVGKGEHVVK